MDLFSLFTFLGGLAMFLFGMHVLSEAIGRQAGGSLKNALERLTSSKVAGVLLGAGVTAVIQSSGATIVMVIGFVNSGIMTLENSIGIIMGANIGTTATAWILSLNSISGTGFWLRLISPDSFVPVLAFIGAVLLMMAKRDRNRDIGIMLLGFSILMVGMSTMSDAMSPLTESEAFKSILLAFANPILGVLAGFIMTAVLQSSSAAVGILQAAAVTGGITFGNSIPLIMGQNIGACLVVLLASAGTNRDAKRAAWIHLLFNIIGTVIFIIPFCVIKWAVGPAWLALPVNPVEIAVLHTGFKLLSTVVLLPFTGQLVKLSKLIIPTDQEDEKFQLLDENFLKTPSVAVARCTELTCAMAELSKSIIYKAIGLVKDFDEAGAGDVRALEDEIDTFEDKIGGYLLKLSGSKLSEQDSREVSKMLCSIGDFERISDHALNIMESGEELHKKGIRLSDAAYRELDVLFNAVREVCTLAVSAFVGEDLAVAKRVEPLEQLIDDMKDEMRDHHIERLKSGECSATQGFVFSDILTNMERVSDHCSNIALSVIQLHRSNFEPHSYANQLKFTDPSFGRVYDEYRAKYALK